MTDNKSTHENNHDAKVESDIKSENVTDSAEHKDALMKRLMKKLKKEHKIDHVDHLSDEVQTPGNGEQPLFDNKLTSLFATPQKFIHENYTRVMTRIEDSQDKALSESGFTADMNLNNLEKPSRKSHIILIFTVSFFIIALLWANFAVLDEVTTGVGKVIPSSQIQVVQNLEGGIVNKILVREGDIVERGQELMHFDDTRFKASYDEANIRESILELMIARLESEVENKEFVISDSLKKKFPTRIKHALMQHESRLNEMSQMKKSYELAKKELDLTRPLVKSGAASEVEILRQERSVNDLKTAMHSFESATLDELNKVRSELAGIRQSNLALEDRLERTTIRSPVRGIVKQLKVNTIGGVIQPGMDIFEIVPLDDTLLIEAKIRPADIGFIHPNQTATVKISAYDYSIYGGLTGIIEQISADTITDEKDESFYIIRVRTSKNHLRSKDNPLKIIPGMSANVDILTGHKTVLNYILKPILKAKQNSMRER